MGMQNKAETAYAQKLAEAEIEIESLKARLEACRREGREAGETVVFNVNELIMPLIDKLRRRGLDESQAAYVDILETYLKTIVSPFSHNMATRYKNLTPKEIQVANLVKQGKKTAEIAELLGLSFRTVESHRDAIRYKLGLKNKKKSLKSYLRAIQ